jgi:cell division transport system permease protein
MAKKTSKFWQRIRRTPYQSLVAVMALSLTFLVVSVFSLISLGSVKVLRYFENAPQVIAFFESGVDLEENQIVKIKTQLEATGQLQEFKYVSIHEAEAIYREKNQDDPLLLELVDYKILPPSIEVSAQTIDGLGQLKEVLETQPGITDIAFYEDIVQSMSRWIKNIRVFGIGLISYLLLQSILVVMVVTSFKMINRRQEIEVMRLLGASSWFICQPFVAEGMFYGSLSAFIGWGLSYIVLLYSTPFLAGWLEEVVLLPVPIETMLLILITQVGFGVGVGGLASLMASRRYLKV